MFKYNNDKTIGFKYVRGTLISEGCIHVFKSLKTRHSFHFSKGRWPGGNNNCQKRAGPIQRTLPIFSSSRFKSRKKRQSSFWADADKPEGGNKKKYSSRSGKIKIYKVEKKKQP